MPQKSTAADCREVEQVLRLLDAANSLDVRCLHKLFTILSRGQKHVYTIGAKVESTLLSFLNPKPASSESQSDGHSSGRIPPPSTKALSLTAACFTFVPSLTISSRRHDRFVDFQGRLIYCLCDAYLALLEFHGYSQISLMSLHSHVTSRFKTFPSLVPLSRDKIASPELQRLIFARVDFFTQVLRQLFESVPMPEAHMNLPLIVSLFSGVLSVELTHADRATNEVLLRSSRLIHSLAIMCTTLGSVLLPASASLFSLIGYQLDWTAKWSSEKKLLEGLIRHRLAAFNCLQCLLFTVTQFGSDRFHHLLPKLIDHMIEDLLTVSNLDSSIIDSNQTERDDVGGDGVGCDRSSQSNFIAPVTLKRRVLNAVLLTVSKIFHLPSHLQQQHRSHDGNELGVFFEVTVKRQLTRLTVCIMHLIQQVLFGFAWKSTAKEAALLQMRSHPLYHPAILSALCNTGTVLVATVACSPSFHQLIRRFLSEMTLYPDVHVQSMAYTCKERLTSYELLRWNNCVESSKNGLNSSRAASVDVVAPTKVTTMLPPSDATPASADCTHDPPDVLPVTSVGISLLSPTQVQSDPPSKRMRLSENMSDTESVVRKNIPHSDVSITTTTTITTNISSEKNSSTVGGVSLEACLAAFDPTFQ